MCAIILAAGKSRRMGSQKLLLPFGGQTMIGQVVDRVLAAGLMRTIVVVAREARDVPAALAGKRVSIVENPQVDGDMLSSVRAGLERVPEGCDAVMVVLGDQPMIETSGLARLIDAMKDGGKGIVIPVHGAKRGHPMLFSMRYGNEVLTRFDGEGLRGLAEAHPGDVGEVEADATALEDVDYPDDYQRALEGMKERDTGEGGGRV